MAPRVFVTSGSFANDEINWRQQIFDVDAFYQSGSRDGALSNSGDWLILASTASFGADSISRYALGPDGEMTQLNSATIDLADVAGADGRPVFSHDDSTVYVTAYVNGTNDADGDGITDAHIVIVAMDFNPVTGEILIRDAFETSRLFENYQRFRLDEGQIVMTLSPEGDVLYQLDTYHGRLTAYAIQSNGDIDRELDDVSLPVALEGDLEIAPTQPCLS